MDVLEAVKKKVKGPCVILAGAGTGKTYAIVEKIKHLIKQRIYDPKKIVCITFSNEAANNLMTRVRAVLDDNDEEPIIRTFHGFSSDLLKKYGNKIAVDENFKILDPDQAMFVLHRNFRIQGYYCRKYIASIGTAKDLGISISALEEYINKKMKMLEEKGINLEKKLEELQFQFQTLHLRKDKELKKELLKEIRELNNIVNIRKFLSAWKAYEKLKTKSGYQDYSDLNMNALQLLVENPEISDEYDYVIVDEFQDTNKLQLDLLINLAKHRNITVVGDMNQSIYRFRGAYKDNIKLFKSCFSNELEIINLDKSRRSSNKILRTAHKLILNNYQDKGECFEVRNFEEREGSKIDVYELVNGREEARKVAEIVEKEVIDGKYEDICVLFRTHQQGRAIKLALESKGIPYSSVSKSHLLKQNVVKTIIDYLVIVDKIMRNKKGGEQAWWDLIYQLGFNDRDLIKIGRFIKDNRSNENISSLLLNNIGDIGISDSGIKLYEGLKEKIRKIAGLEKDNIVETLQELFLLLGINEENKNDMEKEAFLNINKLYEIAQSHSSLYYSDIANFLDYIEAVEVLGLEIPAAELENKGVRLMTNHATKGLEFKTVIITNMADRRFPIERFEGSSLLPVELSPEFNNISNYEAQFLNEAYEDYERKHQLMEERRLCYVAFTRAKEKLILTYAGDYAGKRFYPSIFLREIECKDNKDIDYYKDYEEKYVVPELEKKPRFSSILSSDNFDGLIKEISKDNNIREKQMRRSFSPSALLLFSECEKEYEYKYVYHMPERKTISWEAIRLGSFVHLILERGVKKNFMSVKEFIDYAKDESVKEEWEGIELNDAIYLIRIFFERNRDKYNEKSMTEQELRLKIEDFEFLGFADRIDFSDKGVEIVDYKTGKQAIMSKHRDWQLGYYALAASKYGKVYKVTLDMLKQEMPLEFQIDDKGDARSVNYPRVCFNIYDVRNELVRAARAIMDAHKNGFKACPVEKNCEFCNEFVYGL